MKALTRSTIIGALLDVHSDPGKGLQHPVVLSLLHVGVVCSY